MRLSCLLAVLALTGCAKPPVAPPPLAEVPDWLELNGAMVIAELRNTPQELAAAPFAPWKENRARLLLYPYPQVRHLTLPVDGVARDIAFFDVGGRVIDAYPAAACVKPSGCPALPSRFPAMSVLIAPAGTLSRHAMVRASQMRWIDGVEAARKTRVQLSAVIAPSSASQ